MEAKIFVHLNGSSVVCVGNLAARERRMDARTGQHDHGDHVVGVAEAKRSADKQFDLVVNSLHPGVGEMVFRSRYNGVEEPLNLQAQVTKHRDSAPLRPRNPLIQGGDNLVRTRLERVRRRFSFSK